MHLWAAFFFSWAFLHEMIGFFFSPDCYGLVDVSWGGEGVEEKRRRGKTEGNGEGGR